LNESRDVAALYSQLSREPKSMILCESLTPLTLGRGVSYKDGSIRAGSHRIDYILMNGGI
jgi:hypothetical protein